MTSALSMIRPDTPRRSLGHSLDGLDAGSSSSFSSRRAQDQWLPSLHDLRPITRLSYETLTRLPIVPHIGSVQLAKLTIHDCDRLYEASHRPRAAPP